MGISERRAREKNERRQMIIDAAKKHFSSKGFNGTTMEEIAQDIELSPSTLYLYFSSKEELHAALSLKLLENLLAQLNRIKESKEKNPMRLLISVKEMLLDIYARDPLMLMNVFHFQTSEVYKNISSELIEEIKEFAGHALQTIADIFEDGIQQQLFREENPVALADIIWSLFSGMVIWEESKRALDARKVYLKETLDLAFDLFIRGIALQDKR